LSGGDIVREDNIKDGPIIPTDSSPNGNPLFIQRTNVLNTTNKKRAGKQKKPGWISRPVQVKYGVIIPCSVKHAKELDTKNGNTLWADAITKEIDSLLRLGCFDFHAPDFKSSSEYQFAKLTMIFEVKQDGQCKTRLVLAGGHMVKPRGISSRSMVMKGISIRLLDLFAHRDGLRTLCGDIGNAFITADCLEKILSIAGPEFGEREDSVMLFAKAVYGLHSRQHFLTFMAGGIFSHAIQSRCLDVIVQNERWL
jgi:hypothetical protein